MVGDPSNKCFEMIFFKLFELPRSNLNRSTTRELVFVVDTTSESRSGSTLQPANCGQACACPTEGRLVMPSQVCSLGAMKRDT